MGCEGLNRVDFLKNGVRVLESGQPEGENLDLRLLVKLKLLHCLCTRRVDPACSCPTEGKTQKDEHSAFNVLQHLTLEESALQQKAKEDENADPKHKMKICFAWHVGAGERNLLEAGEAQFSEKHPKQEQEQKMACYLRPTGIADKGAAGC